MKGIQITIGNEVFSTKKKATEKIRSIVNSKELITTSRRIEIDEYTTAYDCDPYSEPLKGDEHEFVNNLLKLHPDSKNKIGTGIDYFFIKEVCRDGGISRCFYIKRKDDTETHFSWRECLTPSKEINKVYDALRHYIQSDLLTFKNNYFDKYRENSICAISGKTIKKDQADVDHTNPTFKELADQFIKKENKIHIGTDEEIVGHYMTDHDQMIEWGIYHDKNANLQIVDRKEHQRKRKNV